MTKKLREVEVGMTLGAVRERPKPDFDVPCVSANVVSAALPEGVRLIEARVRSYLSDPSWHYRDCELVVLEVGRWSGLNRIKAGWSVDDKVFGLAEFVFDVPEDYWDEGDDG